MIVIVTGSSGLVGKNLQNLVKNDTENSWIFLNSKSVDLRNTSETISFFKSLNANYIIHLAANVGGLYKNLKYPVEMLRDNLRINENVLEASYLSGINKGIFILSSCIYPYKPDKYPMLECDIDKSPPHPSNEGYAISKRVMLTQCKNYNKEYGTKYSCISPVNLYGPYDNFDPINSHVIPGIMRRMIKCKEKNIDFAMYGTGKPLRQFIFAKDLCKIIIIMLKDNIFIENMNIANDEISIKNLTLKIREIIDFNNNIVEDNTKSDGCLKKTVSNDLLKKIFPGIKFTSLNDGLKETYDWFQSNFF